MSIRQVYAVVGIAALLMVAPERATAAQDALDSAQLPDTTSAVAAAAVAAAPLASALPDTEAVAPEATVGPHEFSPIGRPSWFVPVHVFTATVHVIEAHSTLDVLKHRGVETAPLYREMTGNKWAFLAVKAGLAATVIYATEKLSRRHRVAAVLTAAAVNSVYLTMATRNYRSVRALESQLGRR